MSNQYVRVSGNVYGPFSQDQLAQMRAAGRVNDQSEVSFDRVNWRPLGGGTATPPGAAFGAGISAAGQDVDTKQYLERLRNQTRYPFYRTTVLVASILGYVTAALPIVALVVQVVWSGLSSVGILQPLGVVIASALIVVFVTVTREVASMYADFVDSTLARHARDER